MSELEDRLRAAVGRQSAAYEPSADLPERIEARIRRQGRRHQLRTGGLVAAAAAAVALVALVAVDRGDDESIRLTDDDRGDVTTLPTPSSTSSSTSTSTSTSTTAANSTTTPLPGIDALTPQTRQGIGPITAGMTVREAQEVGGISLTPSAVGDGSCLEAAIDVTASGAVLVVEATGGDPMDGIVRAVVGSVGTSADGAIVGQTRSELLATLGQPTRVEDGPLDGEILVFEEAGYAYGAFVHNDLVLGLQSGDPAWVTNPDGCPEGP